MLPVINIFMFSLSTKMHRAIFNKAKAYNIGHQAASIRPGMRRSSPSILIIKTDPTPIPGQLN
jgi:hypothetical protein